MDWRGSTHSRVDETADCQAEAYIDWFGGPQHPKMHPPFDMKARQAATAMCDMTPSGFGTAAEGSHWSFIFRSIQIPYNIKIVGIERIG